MAAPESADPGTTPADEKLILVVDDDDSVRELLVHVCFHEGFRVEVAEDGEMALNSIAEHKPDLVLLDLMLPRRGGYEVLRRLQEGETAAIPVVVITARPMDGSTEGVLRQEPNVRAFVRKPFEAESLVRECHSLLKTGPARKFGRRPSK